jgi:16S rRNA (guanine(966)-N(2))-methyltransferase RsmD
MRVVSGCLRGRLLFAGSGRDIRPTSERARAGLFDWLGSRVDGARVLDLFAGCGALGIEALSRGAQSVVFVECARTALAALRRNVASLRIEDRAAIAPSDVRRFLARSEGEPGRFDLILADPPYGEDWAAWLAGCARLAQLLAPGGVFVAERSVRDPEPAPGPGLRLRGAKRYGETVFDWFDREESAS